MASQAKLAEFLKKLDKKKYEDIFPTSVAEIGKQKVPLKRYQQEAQKLNNRRELP
jgi:hypothetical protein